MFLTFLSSSIRLSTIYLYGATGEIITEKSGHLNLGIPGVMCIGAVGGCLGISSYAKSLGDLSQMNGFGVVMIGILCTLIFGAFAGALFSFLTVTLRCNQNVTGLTLTTFGAGFIHFTLENIDRSSFSEASKYFAKGFVNGQNLDWFSKLFLNYGTLVYLAIAIAIIAAIILKKTRTGLNLCAVGENPATADAAGISVGKYRYLATIIGSAIAALGGLFYIMDFAGGIPEYNIESHGWIAVALVIFTIWKPNWSIFGAILFAALYFIPGFLPSIGKGFYKIELIKLLPYVVTVLVLIITSIFGRKSVQPPAALGTTYFREER